MRFSGEVVPDRYDPARAWDTALDLPTRWHMRRSRGHVLTFVAADGKVLREARLRGPPGTSRICGHGVVSVQSRIRRISGKRKRWGQ